MIDWCADKESYRIKDGDYRRYACGNVYHREKVHKLARLDGHNDYDVVLGFFTLGDP